MGGKTRDGWIDSTVVGKRRAVLGAPNTIDRVYKLRGEWKKN
jgi:hypothetical protein